MKKENWLSLIIPIFNLLFAGLLFTGFAVTGGVPIAMLCYIVGSAVSIFFVIKYRLNICRQIPVHIVTFIAAVAAGVTAFNNLFYGNNLWITIGLPVITAVATVILFLMLKCGFKEKLVLILTSPLVYYAFTATNFAVELLKVKS